MRLQVNLTAAKWGDGGWKPNYFDIDDRYLCRFMYKYAEKTMRELSDRFNTPQSCPFPAVILLIYLYIFQNNRVYLGPLNFAGNVFNRGLRL